ncbi:EpsG family [Bifidobacterium boum]|uniref:EpsG family n=3 Tax=Bifidobacterium boum TaxID=78343 RepID=A0A086ZLR6_9BIFI|nr:EpsG family [Bifidobacterium boum]
MQMALVLYIIFILVLIVFEYDRIFNYIIMIVSPLVLGFVSWIWILRPDYNRYESTYYAIENISDGKAYPVWSMIMLSAKVCHLQFRLYQTIIVILSISIIEIVAFKMFHRVNATMGTIWVYPGIIGIIQIRQYFSLSLLYLSLFFFIRSFHIKKSRENKQSCIYVFASILFALLSVGVHATSIVMVTFYLLYFFNGSKIKYVICLFAVLFIAQIVYPAISNKIMISILGEQQTTVYDTYGVMVGNNISEFSAIAVALVICIVNMGMCKYINKKKNLNDTHGNAIATVSLLETSEYVSFVPLLLNFLDTMRLQRFSILTTAGMIDAYPFERKGLLLVVRCIFFGSMFILLRWSAPWNSMISELSSF